ncbi:ABC transporter permease [Variovorax sp. J31P179]|uniref:ABC transporter permease n=1 Tax=Variovorax sp. J31P179 TaxID=3053508 RepID=UPI002577E81C|nr:ABC transporter permease [Variovorax sp. J31P179]MDM0083297.1 ABC transporter permease [Variovorax sp. J31P179]
MTPSSLPRPPSASPRSALQVSLSVWRALFMREALSRVSSQRYGWVWLLLQPVVHIALLMLLFSTLRQRTLAGADFALFLALGLLGYQLFTNTAQRSASALAANRGLLAYRQVLPVDTVLVRAVVEGSLQLLVGLVLLSGAALFRFDVLPHDPLLALEAYLLLWLFGSGLGLALSVGYALVPEIEKIMGFVFMPLYFASGVLFSPAAMPARLQEWLLYNPIVHGLELGRAAFFPGYHLVQGLSPGYLASFGPAFWLLGLALHRRFAKQVAAQ